MTPIFSRLNSNTGFTLIELLVVMGVLSMVAMLMTGSFDRRPGAVARGEAAQKMRAAIEEARWDAARSGHSRSVDPAAIVAGASLAPLVPLEVQGAVSLVVHPDGSTSGGTVLLDAHPLLRVDWLTGDIARAP